VNAFLHVLFNFVRVQSELAADVHRPDLGADVVSKSSSERMSVRAACRFWLITTKVERSIASRLTIIVSKPYGWVEDQRRTHGRLRRHARPVHVGQSCGRAAAGSAGTGSGSSVGSGKTRLLGSPHDATTAVTLRPHS
jgi:hypothetical protein